MSTQPRLNIDPVLEPRMVRAALVWGLDMTISSPGEGPSASLAALLGKVAASGDSYQDPDRKTAVRDMLRYGTYKPAGRSKPSSEYLLTAALAGEFPFVNGPVDANNEVSLRWGYPASIFDLAKTGPELLLSRGKAEERYVFNQSGQSIELRDLIVVRRRVGDVWEACGNPVKDSMATKVFDSARDVAGVVYAPIAEPPDDLEECAERFAALLEECCGASEVGFQIV